MEEEIIIKNGLANYKTDEEGIIETVEDDYFDEVGCSFALVSEDWV